MSTTLRQVLILFLIFLANFLFKLIYIGAPSLWYDEIISVQDTLLDFGHIKHEAEWDKNPPFYHYVLWVWCQLFGISVFAVRSMSAFFSALTAILIFVFTKKISNVRNAWISTIVFSFHPYLYYYAQEARCYSLLIFLITINAIVTYSLVIKPGFGKAVLLGVLNFLIFYTHYIAGLILFCQFIYLAILFRKDILLVITIYLIPILLVLLRFTKKQYMVLFYSQEMSRQKANVPLSGFDGLIKSFTLLYVSYIVLIVFFILAIFYFIRKIKQGAFKNDAKTHFYFYLAFAPLLAIFMLYFLGIWTNVFDARYLIFTIPFIIISFSLVIENKSMLFGFAALVLVFAVPGLKFGQSKKMDYQFAAFLAKEIQKKEEVNIVIQTHDVITLFLYYYDRDAFTSKDRKSKEFLASKGIYYINETSDLDITPFDVNKPILLFQTYQKKEDEAKMIQWFKNKFYSLFSTNSIEGVKFTYLTKDRSKK
jgi:uncharacterized membrane protein